MLNCSFVDEKIPEKMTHAMRHAHLMRATCRSGPCNCSRCIGAQVASLTRVGAVASAGAPPLHASSPLRPVSPAKRLLHTHRSAIPRVCNSWKGLGLPTLGVLAHRGVYLHLAHICTVHHDTLDIVRIFIGLLVEVRLGLLQSTEGEGPNKESGQLHLPTRQPRIPRKKQCDNWHGIENRVGSSSGSNGTTQRTGPGRGLPCACLARVVCTLRDCDCASRAVFCSMRDCFS